VRLPATTAGVLWRRSVRRAGKFLPLEQQLGCACIARTIRLVIAGLDPAISMTVARLCQMNRDGRIKSGHDEYDPLTLFVPGPYHSSKQGKKQGA
jgi:hypothetical protein